MSTTVIYLLGILFGQFTFANAYPRVASPHEITLSLYHHYPSSKSVYIKYDLMGGTFNYKPNTSALEVDDAIVFAAKDGGYWERIVGDTIKLSWYNLSSKNADNSAILRKGIQAAIDKRASVVSFPMAGTYYIQSGNYWTIPSQLKLTIDGKGSTIIVDKKAAAVAQETYVMAFKCSDNNSLNSSITIKNLNIKAPEILPQWTNTNYQAHRLVIAMETAGVSAVNIINCKLNDICGYGIRLKNFLSATISGVIETNVGGHFPIENGNDSFGDGIWLGHYDVQNVRRTRKNTNATISSCIIKGYNTATNGNFASRSGITVEAFNSFAPDIVMNVNVKNSTISDYDRNLHVEGISSKITYSNCKIRNFFGIALVIKSINTNLTYDKCTASGLLKANPKQERYGLGGVMQFDSTVDLFLRNSTVFTFNGPASFRANFHITKNSVLDFGNSDVFFDHANLYINSGGSLINIPTEVKRGFNMYGSSVELNGKKVELNGKFKQATLF
ncbi:MAG: hypothetical protein WKF66_12415 [Pedobacter sp.]